MSHESPESKSIPTTQEVVSAFRDDQSAEGKERALQLLSQWEEAAQIEAIRSGGEYSILEYNIALLELMIDANILVEARQYAEDVWEVLNQEHNRKKDQDIPEALHILYDKFIELDERLKAL